MRFDSYIPCDILKPYIRNFAIVENEVESSYKVIPDTGVVIGFQYKGKLLHITNENQVPLSPSGLTGLQDQYRIFKNAADTGTVLIYFKQAGAAVFFKQPIHELFRESVSLDNFMLRSELLLLEERLCEAKTDAMRIEVVEQFLISRMNHSETDALVMAALALIYERKGNIRIKELAEQLHTSQSPLEKRFRKVVGASPKKFSSIVRFKHILESQSLHDSLTALSYEVGFYDQSHFIKEFKCFTGETPEDFFTNMGS